MREITAGGAYNFEVMADNQIVQSIPFGVVVSLDSAWRSGVFMKRNETGWKSLHEDERAVLGSLRASEFMRVCQFRGALCGFWSGLVFLRFVR